MATIAVRVGREVKEISGLTKSTTCWDVVLALLKEKQQSAGTDSATGTNDKAASGEHGTEESASNSSNSKTIKELAQSYVIVENWRGCEKPIPPRTRILNVWQAWGKEQRHVELSLKKSKHIRYRESGTGNHNSRTREGKSSDKGDVTQDHYSLHCMSNHQKRRIRRNMRQYQRAVMMKQNEDDDLTDDVAQNLVDIPEKKRLISEDNKPVVKGEGKSEKRNGHVLSEEKFIDGFLADPDCLIRRADRAALISQGTFNREFCKYRRRNRRRHGSIDSRTHRRRQVSHYPYSSQHDRRRSSRHRGSNSKSQKYRYSTDDTSTTTSTTNSSGDEDAEDADDEKSVLIDFSGSVPRRTHSYGVGLSGRVYSGSGTTTTATDSSTTTSGESMTSSMGGSTSSETSSGGDYFLPELNRLSYGKAIENMKNSKATENSSNKPKKNKSILGGFSKPALNLIESFRKTNLKRKSAKKGIQTSPKQENTTETNCANEPESNTDNKKCDEVENQRGDVETINSTTDATTEKINVTENSEKDKTQDTLKPIAEDDAEEQNGKDEVSQTVQSQNIVLKNQQNRLTDIDGEIQQIENDIHSLRTRALGKNYVQDTYMSGFVDPDANGLANFFNGPSIPVTTPWILQSEDVDNLERFTKMSEKIVEMQLKIEEYNRKAEILLQDMQEEIWRTSTDTAQRNKGRNTVTKAAALMLGFSDDDDSSDDEEGHELLSVKSWKDENGKTCGSNSTDTGHKATQDSLHLELETTRTELEASLYLSIRLAAEIDEVEHKLGTSDYLIQTKGENLITAVRDLAMSEEGISPEVWEEYGELLTAYDLEVQERQYLDALSASNLAGVEVNGVAPWPTEENTLYIDATQPNPTSHCVNHHPMEPHSNSIDQPILPPPALNQALAPWVWCEHCKMEERMMQNHPSHELQHTQPQGGAPPPTLFSKLPLPTPISKSTQPVNSPSQPHPPSSITSGLLPMLPIPDGLMSHHNDSDYEDLPDLTSMGPADPSKSSSLLVENESSNNTDDSGNGSAGSTMSFASSDGSRNSSCDGGSPRPIPILSEGDSRSKQLFSRNGVLRGSWKGHFVFPSNPKQSNSQIQSSQGKNTQLSKSPAPPPPTANSKPRMRKPEPLPKPSSLIKKANVIDPKEQEILMQQQRLIRRNSGGRRKNVNNISNVGDGSSNKESQKLQNVSSNKLYPTESQRNAWSQLAEKSFPNEKNIRSISNYDNDSDTGRSSLHGSIDSDQVTFSETLV